MRKTFSLFVLSLICTTLAFLPASAKNDSLPQQPTFTLVWVIDQDTCLNCGCCYSAEPDIFEEGPNDTAVFLSDPDCGEYINYNLLGTFSGECAERIYEVSANCYLNAIDVVPYP